jgi:L-ascorbate metabolism protein UlaG (beta-lactamase superfamily)
LTITITPVRVADLLAEDQRMPVYLDARIQPLSEQDFDLAGIDIVVNTHLHFDHCGGNHLVPAPGHTRGGARRGRGDRAGDGDTGDR